MTKWWIGSLAALASSACVSATLALTLPAAAEEPRAGSRIAGIAWPRSSFDWPDVNGNKRAILEEAAALAGTTCGPQTEFNAWPLGEDDAADELIPGILSSYETAGWTLTQPVPAEPEVYLGERNGNQVLVWLYNDEDRNALALFTCLIEGSSPGSAEEYAAAVAEGNMLDASSAPSVVSSVMHGLGSLAMLISAGLVFLGMRQRKKARAATTWAEVPGEILSSRIESRTTTDEDGDETTWHTPQVSYRYAFQGSEFVGQRLRFGSTKTLNAKKAEDMLAPYPAGANVTIRVNPANPAEATLEATLPKFRSFFPAAILFGLVGAVLLISQAGM